MATLHPELRYVQGPLIFSRADGFEVCRLEPAWNEMPEGVLIGSTGWADDDLRRFRCQRDHA